MKFTHIVDHSGDFSIYADYAYNRKTLPLVHQKSRTRPIVHSPHFLGSVFTWLKTTVG